MKTSPISAKGAPVNMTPLDRRSCELRRMIVETFAAGGRGHVASAFSLVEILRVLYDDVLRYNPKDPKWPGRDRCVLSKGHGCLALYVMLAEKGFFPREELLKFCKSDGILGGHPEYGKVPGVEASTGSLGHGLSIGVGLAIAARLNKADHRVFVVGSDGESNEGSVWEAAMSAGKHRLANLILLIDYNKQQSYSTTYEVCDLEPFAAKWSAFNWAVEEVDGHKVEEIRASIGRAPFESGKPSVIICHTIKGKGVSCVENNLQWHHKSRLADGEVDMLLSELEVD